MGGTLGLRLINEFQTATHEHCAAFFRLRETSNLLKTPVLVYIVEGALYLTGGRSNNETRFVIAL